MNFGRIGLWLPYPSPIPQKAPDHTDLPALLGIQVMDDAQTQERYSFPRVEGDTIFQPGDLVAYDLVFQNFLNSDDGQPVPTNFQRAMKVPSFAGGRFLGWSYQAFDADLAAKIETIKRWWIKQGKLWPE